MKLLSAEIGGLTLPENLKWITPGHNPFKDLLHREILAIEEEIAHLELTKKTIIKRRKQKEKDYKTIKSLCKAVQSSMKDPPSSRVLLFKWLKKNKPEKQGDSDKKGSSESKDGELEIEIEEEESKDEDEDQNKNKDHSGNEEHKKRKYNISVKKCECCGLEVKRHHCKHTLCEKPCQKEEKQNQKKKPNKKDEDE